MGLVQTLLFGAILTERHRFATAIASIFCSSSRDGALRRLGHNVSVSHTTLILNAQPSEVHQEIFGVRIASLYSLVKSVDAGCTAWYGAHSNHKSS